MTKIKSAFRTPHFAFVAVLAVFTYFFGLWLPFFGPDEPRYAQVAREMFERGDWVTPMLGGFNWFEKPSLLYWTQIASFNVFGVSEYAARIGPALFGLGTIASLWIFGRKSEPSAVADGLTNATRHSFANWLAVIAASTLGILVFSRGASFDITVTFPLTAAMVSFYVFDISQQKRPVAIAPGSDQDGGSTLPLILFYFFIGVAVLAKGLIGIVFPFAIVTLYHILSWRRPSAKLVVSLFWGTLLAAAVAATWYLPMYLKHGWPFIDEFFVQHHFQRFTSNKYQHPQPFYFYLWVLPLMTLPWLPFFFAGCWKVLRGIVSSQVSETHGKSDLRIASSPLLLFAFSWIAIPLAFFSLSGSKLPGYILPAVPPAIIIAAWYIFGLVAESGVWRKVILGVASAVFLVSIVLLVTAVPKFADFDSVRGLIADAAARGYRNERIYGLHTVSHSAEFYAAGRLLRDVNGQQKKLYSPAEVATEMQRANVRLSLVLVPPEYLTQLTGSSVFRRIEVIRSNGEWVIVAVALD